MDNLFDKLFDSNVHTFPFTSVHDSIAACPNLSKIEGMGMRQRRAVRGRMGPLGPVSNLLSNGDFVVVNDPTTQISA